ncbi:hypothetical protein [Paracoccus sp. DMF]|uniref:hypothetical protein n=1 Tax=Paracoccus sp. DMF TaxID=400837 RepID=UPI0021E4EB00|nr:hypothetical protein [Paracoccus sp. DMF]MCV2449726.1 hypothetical protein [Paracoccus sp. DMF]
MAARRFNLPAKLPIQIIGPTTLQKAREAYSARWGRPWPESDSYLAELVIEAKQIEGLPPGSKARPDAVRETTLDLMRADHEF